MGGEVMKIKSCCKSFEVGDPCHCHCRAEIIWLKAAIKVKDDALNAWIHCYAPEFCKKEYVAETYKKIREAGGTLAFIADAVQEGK